MIESGTISRAMRLAFNKCPECNQKTLVYGYWLRWCSRRECNWYGPQPTKEMIKELESSSD